MSLWSTRTEQLACDRCGSAIGAASYRAWPATLNVTDVFGAPLPAERAGRVLQGIEAAADPELARWLNLHAVENAYEFACPTHGRVWVLAAAITRAIRAQSGQRRWIRVSTRG